MLRIVQAFLGLFGLRQVMVKVPVHLADLLGDPLEKALYPEGLPDEESRDAQHVLVLLIEILPKEVVFAVLQEHEGLLLLDQMLEEVDCLLQVRCRIEESRSGVWSELLDGSCKI